MISGMSSLVTFMYQIPSEVRAEGTQVHAPALGDTEFSFKVPLLGHLF